MYERRCLPDDSQNTNDTNSGHGDDNAQSSSPQPSRDASPSTVPPFRRSRLERQLLWDSAARWVLFVGLFLALAPSLFGALLGGQAGAAQGDGATFLLLLVVVGWVWLSVSSTKVARQLGLISMLLDEDVTEAESRIAQGLDRKPLQRTVRLLLYHRLAVLRHRQNRFEEAGAICHALLTRHLGAAEQVRVHLLLMLAESRLHCGDAAGAYASLAELHQRSLRLLERMQLVALQLRYEVALGQNDAAMQHIAEKVKLIELMPAAQCGAVHAMLAVAATRAGRPRLADWLHRRARLLCSEPQLETLNDLLNDESDG